MDIDEGGKLGRRAGYAGIGVQSVEFGAGSGHGLVEAPQFARHIALAQLVVGNLQRRMRDQVCTTDRDAAGNGLAVQAEGHCNTPFTPTLRTCRR